MAENSSTSDAPENDEAGDSSDDELLKSARSRYALARDAWRENRDAARDDLIFRSGSQWDDVTKSKREQDRRPCLTFNRLQQHVQQVTNDQRQNRPSIKVHGVDDEADPDTAKVFQGVIRHIELNSGADAAYDTAVDGAAGEGWGYFRALTEYCDPLSFDQEILIKRIRDRFSVTFDPYSQEPDGSDANYAFIEDSIPKEDYLARYGESKLASDGAWSGFEQDHPEWVLKDSVRIAEYFYKEFRDDTLLQLSSGKTILKSQLPEAPGSLGVDPATGAPVTLMVGKDGQPVSRPTRIPKIHWCKTNGCEVLERTTLPGHWIPIIPVYGTEHVIDGKVIRKGLVRDAKDPQRLYNYMKTAEAEMIGLAPKAPYLVEHTQIEGFENQWDTANTDNHPYLKFRSYDADGRQLPAPQRQTFEPAVGAIVQSSLGAAEDIKATTGQFDASMGRQSNETSGKAILARANQAQTSTFHYTDNLTRSMRHLGRILIAWIPEIYDAERTIRIIGEDEAPRVVKLNAEFEENGKTVHYRTDIGKYDVTVDVGPSYASKRQEAAETMLELAKASPQVMQSAPDLLVGKMDFNGAKEVADRLKKTLPPGLAEDQQGAKPIPPEVQAQMAALAQQNEQLQAELKAATDPLELKRMELESKERIEFKKLEVQVELKIAELDIKSSLEMLAHEVAELKARQGLVGMNQPIEDGQSQEFGFQADGAAGASFGAEPMNPAGGELPVEPMEPQ